MSFTIEVATEEQVRAVGLGQRVRQFNYRVVGAYPEMRSIWLNATDAAGNFLGGFRGDIMFDWLFVNILFVEEAHRRRGIGSRLLAEGEARARRNGARHARLDTFDWQAPDFYPKHGYRELLRMPDYYKGRALHLMAKDL